MVGLERNGMYFHKIFPEDTRKRRTTKIGSVRTKDIEWFPITKRMLYFNFNMSMDNSVIISISLCFHAFIFKNIPL